MTWIKTCWLIACVAMVALACKEPDADEETSTREPTKPEPVTAMTAKAMIDANKGKIQVVLLGMPGCPGTEEATPTLIDYATRVGDPVVVWRVDVPPSAQALKSPEDLDPALKYIVDTDRTLAAHLEFFFYPTLFILDQDLAIRYHGDADMAAVEKMVTEIAKEDPQASKNVYTVPLPKVGETIVNFELPMLDGTKSSLSVEAKSDANLILFCNTTCPYSCKAAKSLDDLKKAFPGKSLSTTIINFGQSKETIQAFYADIPEAGRVLVDHDRTISRQTFKVMATPFFFVLDAGGKVLARQPFTVDRAKGCLGKALGVSVTDGAQGGFG